jgi:hypothetical protein
MHETLTRASDFWNVAIDEFGPVFSRRRIASRLKTLGLPIPRATGDDDSDSDASEEKPSADTDAPASAQRLGKALHQLHKLRGTTSGKLLLTIVVSPQTELLASLSFDPDIYIANFLPATCFVIIVVRKGVI